jgi:hypothetical protein
MIWIIRDHTNVLKQYLEHYIPNNKPNYKKLVLLLKYLTDVTQSRKKHANAAGGCPLTSLSLRVAVCHCPESFSSFQPFYNFCVTSVLNFFNIKNIFL